MAWDPTQGQGQGQQQPAGGGADPYSGYGTPPPQNPYGTPPPQSPYGTPPPQSPYGTPQFGYAPPQQPARPVGQSLQELPNQYINVLTHPSDRTFEAEMVKSDWAMVWVQLIILIVAGVILGLISGLFASAIISAATGSANTFGALSSLTVATSAGGAFFRIILIPLFFFIGVGIQFLLAKAFSGQGTFLAQSYTTLLFQVPLNIIGYVLGTVFAFIPVAGAFLNIIVSLALYVYAVILNIFQIKAVHRLSTGQAAAVVLIPLGVLILLGILCVVAFAALFVSILNAGGR